MSIIISLNRLQKLKPRIYTRHVICTTRNSNLNLKYLYTSPSVIGSPLDQKYCAIHRIEVCQSERLYRTKGLQKGQNVMPIVCANFQSANFRGFTLPRYKGCKGFENKSSKIKKNIVACHLCA